MRRKNRKWVAMAAAVYLFIMWSAYRWGVAQRPTDGNFFDLIEREAARKQAEKSAKEAAAKPQATGESRLNAAGPAFVAARYDATHVVFVVVAETESRFTASPHFSGNPSKIPAPRKPAAPLAGLQELWELDSQALHFFPEIVQNTRAGERWSLNVSPESTIPVAIDRVVVAPTGCSLAMGFLASVPAENRAGFAASAQQYFAVRRRAVEPTDPPVVSHIAELEEWKPSAAVAKLIEQQLAERMKQEVAKIDARLIANAGSPGTTSQLPVARAQLRLKEWIHVDSGLMRGEGTLDYDVRAFRLTPDGAPRLFVRARWKLANAPVFLMTAWFKMESNKATTGISQAKVLPTAPASQLTSSSADTPVLVSADASWSSIMREGESAGNLGDRLDFQTVLNEFDADRDGWAELLIHSDLGNETTIALYLYSDLGLAPLKTPFRRDSSSPESCVDP